MFYRLRHNAKYEMLFNVMSQSHTSFVFNFIKIKEKNNLFKREKNFKLIFKLKIISL